MFDNGDLFHVACSRAAFWAEAAPQRHTSGGAELRSPQQTPGCINRRGLPR